MTQEERGRTESLASSYLAQGVTFDFAGEERPFPLDAVPRVIEYDEWSNIEKGVQQRVRRSRRSSTTPTATSTACATGAAGRPHRVRSTSTARPPASTRPTVRIQVAGIDLIRDEHGEMRVLEDNVRVPSGVSYVISNRRVMAQTLPELFVSMRAPRRLPEQAAAGPAPPPRPDRRPNVVVLTPGVYNSAYFEHTLLARLMGVELVEGATCSASAARSSCARPAGPSASTSSTVGSTTTSSTRCSSAPTRCSARRPLLAARLGNVTIANAVGNGVADDKLLYTYVPDLIRYYLAEEPILKNVDTWRLEEPDALEEVLDRLDELVVKPVDGSGGKGLVVGPDASPAELEKLRAKLIADPRGWIAQPVVMLDHPDARRGRHAPAARRPAPVRRQQRRRGVGAAGRLTRVALPKGSSSSTRRRAAARRTPGSSAATPARGRAACKSGGLAGWSPTRHPSRRRSRSSTTRRPRPTRRRATWRRSPSSRQQQQGVTAC
jgi:uncharacterized circularly permuted ATP-grasp superfamily protein